MGGFNFRQQCLHKLVLTVSSVFIHNLTKNSTNLTATHRVVFSVGWFFVALAVVVLLFFSQFCFLSLTATKTKMYQYFWY